MKRRWGNGDDAENMGKDIENKDHLRYNMETYHSKSFPNIYERDLNHQIMGEMGPQLNISCHQMNLSNTRIFFLTSELLAKSNPMEITK